MTNSAKKKKSYSDEITEQDCSILCFLRKDACRELKMLSAYLCFLVTTVVQVMHIAHQCIVTRKNEADEVIHFAAS